MKLLNIADTDLQSVVDEVTRTGGEQPNGLGHESCDRRRAKGPAI